MSKPSTIKKSLYPESEYFPPVVLEKTKDYITYVIANQNRNYTFYLDEIKEEYHNALIQDVVRTLYSLKAFNRNYFTSLRINRDIEIEEETFIFRGITVTNYNVIDKMIKMFKDMLKLADEK